MAVTAATPKGDHQRSAKRDDSPIVRVTKRKINPNTVLQLFVAAAGRCEFRGCNRKLTIHPVTQQRGNFGQVAHIVAFSEQGPRGNPGQRPLNIHDPNNLMLLCHYCHKEIDDHPDQFSVERLRADKADHEQRVGFATGLTTEQRTAIVQLVARVDGQPVKIPTAQIHEAILPKYPLERPNCIIDLNAMDLGEMEAFDSILRIVDKAVRELFATNPYTEPVHHLSIFALAPIPVMVYLGYQVGNTVPADVYRHHRDTDDWRWQEKDVHVQFASHLVRPGSDRTAVALLLSISGTVLPVNLPPEIDERFYIYEIAPIAVQPSTNCLKTRQELENFKRTYEECRREIYRKHPGLRTIHLFPAVPSPVAILCGRELMPKVDAALAVYDYDKRSGGFNYFLEVNQYDT